MVIKYDDPLSVGVGAFAALAAVSGLGALIGRVLLNKIRSRRSGASAAPSASRWRW